MPSRLTPAQIAAAARARGYDPQAVLAVANQEGLGGGIGDGGHAYGPFQLNNAGGVITQQYGGRVNDQSVQNWAWSPEGVSYALDRMGAAKGLRGAAAIKAIVTQFERPADPQGEIARALAAYGGGGGQMPGGGAGGAAPLGAPQAPAAAVAPPVQPALDRRGLVNALLNASSSGDYSGFFAKAGQARQARQAPPVQPLPAMSGARVNAQPLPYTGGGGGRGRGGFAELLHEGVGGPTHSTGEHIHFASTDPQTELRAIKLAQSLGLSVRENPYTGDTVDPVHAKHSYHYRTFPGTYNGKKLGEAADASGDRAAMLKLYQLLGGK